ncbi:MAG: fibronectin type III domain-containing protein, partial [Treponema sp.]|nr:fibronectin type III domain-containing protein [Treponema sp.]
SGGTISINEAIHGGGVGLSNSTFTMSGNADISSNTAKNGHGGGVLVGNNSTFTMNSGTISDNHAINGAGIGVDQASRFIMEGGTITKNIISSEYGHGGGVAAGNGSTFIMNEGTVSENEATYGGGVSIDSGANFILNNGTITENTANHHGGGVRCNGTFIMGNGTISGNYAGQWGGGVNVEGGIFTITNGTISNNEAEYGGGGVHQSGGEFNMDGGTISGNITTNTNSGGVDIRKSSKFSKTGGIIYGNEAGDLRNTHNAIYTAIDLYNNYPMIRTYTVDATEILSYDGTRSSPETTGTWEQY